MRQLVSPNSPWGRYRVATTRNAAGFKHTCQRYYASLALVPSRHASIVFVGSFEGIGAAWYAQQRQVLPVASVT